MISPIAGGIVVRVRVVTRASRPGAVGIREGELVVRLRSAPVDNAANDELVERIADIFGVPRRAVAVASGERSRSKRVSVAGIDEATANARLKSQLSGLTNS